MLSARASSLQASHMYNFGCPSWLACVLQIESAIMVWESIPDFRLGAVAEQLKGKAACSGFYRQGKLA